MAKEMLINISEGEECRIAIVENGRLEELYMERTSATSHVGNIYKGRVTNVEPSIQAAFIDFGLGRNGFLHISDLMPTYFGHSGEDIQESVGRKMARRDRPPIQRCLRRGDEMIVQIIKEGIGTKGPTLSTYLSIPGRILVMMPGMSKLGVSRKIEDEEERRRLRKILDELHPPKDCGFIIRTAGVGKTKADIGKDLQFLTRLWQNVDKKIRSGPAPMELYTEGDLVTRTVRDVYTPAIERIIIDNKEVADHVTDFFKIAMPRTKAEIVLHDETVPLFHKYGIEREIEQMYSRHVPLPSGGSLVIDSTEAVVAIDVNSGKFRDHSDAEMTAFKTDLEAADEIPRQLRLRDLGGVIICDFIDLRYERHRRELEKKLHEHLADDRAKTKMLRMSEFGIIEMTRQRMRPSLKRSIYFDCPHCKGAGLVKTAESMALDVMRRLAIAISDARVSRMDLTVCPEVALHLQNRKRLAVADLETKFEKRITIKPDPNLGMDESRFELWDARDGLVFVEELGMGAPMAAPIGQPPQQGGRPPRGQNQRPPQGQGQQGQRPPQRGGERGGGDQGRREGRDQRGGRGDGRRDERGQQPRQQGGRQQQPSRRDMEEGEDRFDMDRVEDAVEEREVEQREEVGSDERMSMSEERDSMNEEREGMMDERGPSMEREEGGNEREAMNEPEPTEEGPGRPGQEQPPRQQGHPSGMNEAEQGRSRGRRRGRRGRGGRGRGNDQRQDQFENRPISQQEPPREEFREPEGIEVGGVDEGREEVDEAAEARWEEEERQPLREEQPEPAEAPQPMPEVQAKVVVPPAELPAEVEEAPPEQAPAKGRRPRAPRAPKKAAQAKPAAQDGRKKPKMVKKTAPRPTAGRRKKSGGQSGGGSEPATEPAPAPAVVQTPVIPVRTGSTDRHLVSDEPIIPPPVSRPRTYRDLDHIPDDLD
jgi:ribonuclease E